jgi:hypothetical protein
MSGVAPAAIYLKSLKMQIKFQKSNCGGVKIFPEGVNPFVWINNPKRSKSQGG